MSKNKKADKIAKVRKLAKKTQITKTQKYKQHS